MHRDITDNDSMSKIEGERGEKKEADGGQQTKSVTVIKKI